MIQWTDMGTKIITGRLHRDLEEALFEHVSMLKAEDPLSPLHVLVGSNLLGAYLRRKLSMHSGGHINVRFVTFPDLVRLLDEPDAPSPPALAERAIIEGLVSAGDLPPSFDPVSGSAGFGDALLATFTDLLEGGCGAEVAGGIASGSMGSGPVTPRTRDLFTLYGRFLGALEEGGVHDRYARVRSRLAGGKGVREIPGPLLAYGFYDFNGLQHGLLESLESTAGVVLFMPRTGGDVDRFADPALHRFEGRGCEIARAAEAPRDTPAVELFNAPGEEEEARALVRRVIGMAAEGDALFGSMGILLPSKEIYLPLVTEALEEAGIPFYRAYGRDGPGRTVRRGVELLLGMISGDMERGALVDFLASAPLPPAEGAADAYGLWIRESAAASMTGAGGWSAENAALRERLAAGGEGKRQGMVRAIDAVQRVIESVERVRGAAAGRMSWSGFSALISGAVRDLFRADGSAGEIADAIERIGDLDRFTGPVTFESYRRLLMAHLSRRTGAEGRLMGGGVHLLSLGEARGLSFEHVFVPGLAERIFPSPPRQDPLLPDRERRAVAQLTGGRVFLSERGRRIEEEALIFSLALDSALRGLVCSYPRMEEETGRERIESSFLRYIEGYSPLGNGLEPRRLRRFGRSGDEPLGPAEYDFLRAVRGEPFQPHGRFFERAVRMEEARTGRGSFSPYEGVFSDGEALEALRAEKGKSYSTTSLECYAKCPFAYFLENILGIEQVDDQEYLIRLSPLTRGRIVHDILACLYERFAEEGLLPLEPDNRQRIRRITEEVAEARLAECREREPVGTETFWRVERRLMKEAIERHVDVEAGNPRDMVPAFFERSFGCGEQDVSIETACGGISFHGRIDRIDVGPGGRFSVVDYKTGKLSNKDKEIGGGKNLQLHVYLLAASALLGSPVTGGEARYLRVGPGGGMRSVGISGLEWEENEEEFRRVTGTIARCIGAGFFPAIYGERCTHCAVKGACLTDARIGYERKAPRERRCREYIDMRGEKS